mgnify:CR=1 FL=1
MTNRKHLRFYETKQSIERDIIADGLMVGDPLPPTQKLADKYDVSYMTARRAVEELIQSGVVARDPGCRASIAKLPASLDSSDDKTPRRVGNMLILTMCMVLREPDSYLGRIFRALEEAAYANNWNPMLNMVRSVNDLGGQIEDQLRPGLIDGVIVSGVYHDFVAEKLFEFKTPVVYVDFVPANVISDSVTTNNNEIIRKAMDHLIGLGQRRIDFIGQYHSTRNLDKDLDSEEQEFYWRRRINNETLTGESVYLTTDFPLVQTYFEQLMAKTDRPSALYASSPGIADAIYREALKAGLRVPGDLSVITVGGEHIPDLKVSSISINWSEIAHIAVSRLTDLYVKKRPAGARIMHCGEFVDRGSTASVQQ